MSDNGNDIPIISRRDWVVVIVLLALASAAVAYVWHRKYEHKGTDAFVGPHTCKKCHEEQYRDWAETRMAKSFEMLRPGVAADAKKLARLDPTADYTHDDRCLGCHTTGYGLKGGFRSMEETPQMAGVTCEACHGAGGSYAGTAMSFAKPAFLTSDVAKKGLRYPPTEEVCRTCHNERSPFVDVNYVFDFRERVRRGTHRHYALKYSHMRRQ